MTFTFFLTLAEEGTKVFRNESKRIALRLMYLFSLIYLFLLSRFLNDILYSIDFLLLIISLIIVCLIIISKKFQEVQSLLICMSLNFLNIIFGRF